MMMQFDDERAVSVPAECQRIDFMQFEEEPITTGTFGASFQRSINAIQTMFVAGSMFYIGITFSPEHRFHTIREEYEDSDGNLVPADAARAHFPMHWRSLSVLCHGSKALITKIEKELIQQFFK